jgi:predicted lactoylglutathione lyase
MATRWIHKGPTADGVGGAHGFSANDNGVIVHHNGTRAGVVSSEKIRTVTASMTVTAEDTGSVIVADSTTSIVVTLPATTAGLKYTLVVKQATAAGGHAFSPVAVDKFIYAAKADDADLVCTAATDVVGDSVTIVGDGLDGWVVVSKTGTWA